MLPFKEKRYGKFTLPLELLEDDPEMVREILNRVIVIRADNDFMSDGIEYQAYSEDFEPLPEGAPVPRYTIVVTEEVTDTLQIAKRTWKWLS